MRRITRPRRLVNFFGEKKKGTEGWTENRQSRYRAVASRPLGLQACVAIVALLPWHSYFDIIIMYCIMSCHQTNNAGEKRPLEYQNEEVAFVVSQQDEDDGMMMNSNKRQRTAEPESPGVVSITSAAAAMDFHCNEMSIHDCKPWWKQKPVAARAPMMLGGNHDDATTVCCFICKRPLEQKPQSCGNMPCNSLLSYFSNNNQGNIQWNYDRRGNGYKTRRYPQQEHELASKMHLLRSDRLSFLYSSM